jgi:hypothetical protein
VRFAGCDRELDRESVGVDYRMNLAGQTTSRLPHKLTPVALYACRVLMNADDRRIDHLNSVIMSACEGIHDSAPGARTAPANKAIVAGGVGAETVRQVTPGRPRPQY